MDEAMVDERGSDLDGSAVPTIAELLLSYRDRTGHSYSEMAKRVRDELQGPRLQQLATAPPKAFPTGRTVELLSELLEVPTATIVLAFASSLGIPVTQSGTMLERTLPPGTDVLEPEDREAIRYVVRALVDARNAYVHGRDSESFGGSFDGDTPPINSPEPATVHEYGLAARRGESEGRRLRREQDDDAGA